MIINTIYTKYIFMQNISIIYLLPYESLEFSQKKRSVRKPSVQWGKLWGKVFRRRPGGLVRRLVFFLPCGDGNGDEDHGRVSQPVHQ